MGKIYFVKALLQRYSLHLAWVVSFFSVTGSLYFSEIAGYAPCILCWYQRVCMYPILLLLSIGIVSEDKKVYRYIIPLSVIGAIIAFYQLLLYYDIISEASAPCVSGISCTTRYIEWFGFVSIPLLSLLAFVFIILFMVIFKKFNETRN